MITRPTTASCRWPCACAGTAHGERRSCRWSGPCREGDGRTMSRRAASRRGMTLVEVVIGLALFTGVAASAFLALETSSRSYRTETVVSRLDSLAHGALDEVGERL